MSQAIYCHYNKQSQRQICRNNYQFTRTSPNCYQFYSITSDFVKSQLGVFVAV